MNKYAFQQAMRQAARHGKILARGFVRVLYGALSVGLAGVAVATFTAIPAEGGYTAVTDFIAAVATAIVAGCCIYAAGHNRRKKAK